ncbi:MAG: cell division protein ZapA [Proteobacteria bacterium]|nr:MAG: cell division protein ZapA [Pseudomonadota bacterium]
MSDKLNFKVNIMDRDFTVACEDGEQDHLLAAAAYLDRQMRDIQRSGRVIGHERCAIMAALNIANQYLQGGTAPGAVDDTEYRIDDLLARIDDAIGGSGNA